MLARWSEEEKQFVKDNYRRIPIRGIAETLGRTEKATRSQTERMGLGLSYLGASRWTTKEVEVLEEMFRTGKSDREIAERCNRPEKAVSAKRARHGLYKYKRSDVEGKYLDSDGYFKIYDGNGNRRFHHKVVAERMLGRKLKADERVHHINFDKTDDREENLYVCRDRSHHFRVHFQAIGVVAKLVEKGIVSFNRHSGEYETCEKKSFGQN